MVTIFSPLLVSHTRHPKMPFPTKHIFLQIPTQRPLPPHCIVSSAVILAGRSLSGTGKRFYTTALARKHFTY